MKLKSGTLLLVCDASKALFLENKGDEDVLDLRVVETVEQDNPPARDLASDRAGRLPTPTGTQAATDATDFHDLAEDRFVISLAETFQELAETSDRSDLILIADPRSLGRIRKHLNPSVTARLRHEIAKDYTQHPLADIETKISAL